MVASIAMATISCAKKEQQDQNEIKTDVVKTENLSITPENLVEVENEFRIDYYGAAEKYARKEIEVVTTCLGVDMTGTIFPYEDLDGNFSLFEYLKNNKYTKAMPVSVQKDRYLRLSTDLQPAKWQPLVFLTNGHTLGFENPLFEGDNQYYIIYDKKHDQIVFDTELARKIALYIRANKATTENRAETSEYVNRYMKNNLLDHIYEDLIAGNFYYYSEPIDYKRTTTTKFGDGPDNLALIPCTYTIKGTVSNQIMDNYLRMVNCKLVKTNWLIDKEKFFSKQILF